MGNTAVKGYWPPTGMVTIVLAGGRTEQYGRPVLAGDIMLRHPRHHVVRSDFFRASPVMVLKPEEVLMPGHKFLLVPFHTVKKRLRTREELRLRKSSSNSSDCHQSSKDVNYCSSCRSDGTKSSLGVGKKGVTRIPSSRLTVLTKKASIGSPRQARKTLIHKEKLHSRRKTSLQSHRRQESTDSEAAFEPSPDSRELALSELEESEESEDYEDCNSFDSTVVVAKPAASLDLSVPEYESFQSSAKSTINVESLLISVEERGIFADSKGTLPPLEKLIFKDPAPAKTIVSSSGGVSGLGERLEEKQPEKNSSGYVLPKRPQPAPNGSTSLASHLLQKVLDSPKLLRHASDGNAFVNGLTQTEVDSPNPPRPDLERSASGNAMTPKEVDSPTSPRPALDRIASVNGMRLKEVDSPKQPPRALDRSTSVNPKKQEALDSLKSSRPALDRIASVNAKRQKEVDSPKPPRPALDRSASVNAMMQEEVDSLKPSRPALDRIASVNAMRQKEVDSPKPPRPALDRSASVNAMTQEEVDSLKPSRPALDRIASVTAMRQKEVDSPKPPRLALDRIAFFNGMTQKGVDAPKAARPAVDRSASVDSLNKKGVDSTKAARPSLGRGASVNGVMHEGVDAPKAARPAVDRSAFDGLNKKGVDSTKAARPSLGRGASVNGVMHEGVDAPKAARPAVDRNAFDGLNKKGVDLTKAARPSLGRGASVNGVMHEGVDAPKAARPAVDKSAFDGLNKKGVDSTIAARPSLGRGASVNGVMHEGVGAPKAARPAVDKSAFDGLNKKGVDSAKAARPSSDSIASVNGMNQKGVDSTRTARPSLDRGVSVNSMMQREVDSPEAPRTVLSKCASLNATKENRVDSRKPAVNKRASVDDMVQKWSDSTGLSQSLYRPDHRKLEDLNRLSNSPGPCALVKWTPLSEQLTAQIGTLALPAITSSNGPKTLGQQPPSSGEKPLVRYLLEPERALTPVIRSEPQQQKEVSEEKVGYMKELQLFCSGPGKDRIEVKALYSGLLLKSSTDPPQVDAKPEVMVNQQSTTTVVKKEKPVSRNKLIKHLCFAVQQGSQTPLHPAAASAAGDTQETQGKEPRLKLKDHLKRDPSPPNQHKVLQQPAATSVNLQIQQYRVPFAQEGSTGSATEAKTRKELLAFHLSQAVGLECDPSTVRSNGGNQMLTTSIEDQFLKQPPVNYFRPHRIRTRRRVYTITNWKPRLSPLVEFSPTHSELSVKS